MATRTRKSKPATAAKPAADDLVQETGDSGDATGDEKPGLSLSHEDFANNPRVINMAEMPGVDDDSPEAKAKAKAEAKAAIRARERAEAGDDEDDTSQADIDQDRENLEDDSTDEETTADAADRVVPTISPDARTAAGSTSIPNEEPVRGRGPVRMRLIGLTSTGKGRPPYGFTVIAPADGAYDGLVTEGETVHFVRGRSTRVSGKTATWLEGHPELIVEKV